MKKRGQAAFDIWTLLVVVFFIVIPLLYFGLDMNNVFRMSNADDSLRTVAVAAKEMKGLGNGNSKVVTINVPGGIESYSFQDNFLRYTMTDGKIAEAYFWGKVIGTLPTNPGLHRIVVSAVGDETIYIGGWLAIESIQPDCTVFPSKTHNETINIYGFGFDGNASLISNNETLDPYYVNVLDSRWIELTLYTGHFSGSEQHREGKKYELYVRNPNGMESNSMNLTIKANHCR